VSSARQTKTETERWTGKAESREATSPAVMSALAAGREVAASTKERARGTEAGRERTAVSHSDRRTRADNES